MVEGKATQNEEEQLQQWQKLETTLEEYLELLNESNVDDVFKKIINNINIIWGQDILLKYMLCYKSQFGLSSNVTCALIKRLNHFIPEFGFKFTKQLIFTFADSFQSLRLIETLELLALVGDMFNYGVIAELVLLQVLQILSKGNSQKDDTLGIQGIIKLMSVCGKKLKETNTKVHDGILEKLSATQMNDDKIAELWNNLRTLKDGEYESVPTVLIPRYLDHTSDTDPVTFIIAKELKEPDDQLGEFHFVNDLNEITQQWEDLKTVVKQHPIITESEADLAPSDVVEVAPTQNTEKVVPADVGGVTPSQDTERVATANVVKDMTNTADIEFKKEIYLILKSSLSGDEAAHKILKRRTPDEMKFNIVDIIIKSSIQEATYSKFYGIIAERLLNSHKAWKPAFNKIFNENYQQLDSFEPAQLRIVGKFWGHLFATDYIGFELFQIVKINAEESTPPSRIFIKFIFQELVADLSINELKDRLNEEYIQPYVDGMFPHDDIENIRYSINYFTAIGLGVLTDKMRERLTELEEETRGEELEEELEEENEQEDEESPSIHRSVSPSMNTSRYNSRNDRPRFESRGRERSVTPPRYRRGEPQRDRSITPPRNKYKEVQGKGNIPQKYLNTQPQRNLNAQPHRYRDTPVVDNIPQKYRNAQPHRYRNGPAPNRYNRSSSSRYDPHSNGSTTPPPPKRSRYNN